MPLLQQALRSRGRRQAWRPRPLTAATMKQLGEGWNWRELKIGNRFITYGRTLFEADLLNFVTLCGFSEELFTNKEYVKEHAPMRGGHPVPGALVYSMAEGLVIPTTLQGTGLASLSRSSSPRSGRPPRTRCGRWCGPPTTSRTRKARRCWSTRRCA